jgi:hypothetical protein
MADPSLKDLLDAIKSRVDTARDFARSSPMATGMVSRQLRDGLTALFSQQQFDEGDVAQLSLDFSSRPYENALPGLLTRIQENQRYSKVWGEQLTELLQQDADLKARMLAARMERQQLNARKVARYEEENAAERQVVERMESAPLPRPDEAAFNAQAADLGQDLAEPAAMPAAGPSFASKVGAKAGASLRHHVGKAFGGIRGKPVEVPKNIVPLLFDLADGVPFLGDGINLVYNILLIAKAFSRGHGSTALIMVVITLIDNVAGFFLDATGVGEVVDFLIPAASINTMLLARADAKAGARTGGKQEEKQGGMLATENGNPTLLAIALLTMLLVLPFVAAVYGSVIFMVISLIGLALFALEKSFREEYFNALGLVLLLLYLIHLFLGVGALTGMSFLNSTVLIVIAVAAYLVAIVFFALVVADEFTNKLAAISRFTIACVLSIIACALPPIVVRYLPEFMGSFVTVLAAAYPIAVIVCLMWFSDAFPDGYSAGLLKLFIGALAVVMLVIVIMSLPKALPLLPDIQTGSVSLGSSFGSFGSGFIDTWKDGLVKWKGAIQRTVDPGKYYTGNQENTEKPLGVVLENVRVSDDKVGADTQDTVTLYADARAKTFLDTPIIIVPSCTMKGKLPYTSASSPLSVEAYYETAQHLECAITPTAPWKKGTYTLTMSATFPFVTSVDIPYAFINAETAKSMLRQGKDLSVELDLPKKPEATFSNGPVMVGMGGSDQPIFIDPESDAILPPGTAIGITFEPAWGEGKIQSVDEITLGVPYPFTLGKCDREVSSIAQDPDDETYTIYTFQHVQDGPIDTWKSITCPLIIDPSRREAAALLASDLTKTTRTFIGAVKYRYLVEETDTVVVQ